MKYAYLFPGQGAQYVGMGKDLTEAYPTARRLFEEADEALGFSLSKIILEGPEDKLRLTYHTQPALLVTSVAAYRVFVEQGGEAQPVVVAGHSLGEYSALTAIGALDFTEAVRLVHLRGRWMDEAVPAGQGAMSAVMGMEHALLAQICAQATAEVGVVEVANVNCPVQIVISGTKAGVERASEMAREQGARRVIPLVVSGPFHCSLMRPAAAKLQAELEKTAIGQVGIPVVANVDGQPKTYPADIRKALEQQLYLPVLFEQDIGTMLDMGVETFIEFGPGTVLSGLVKKIQRRIPTLHVENESTLQETLAAIRS